MKKVVIIIVILLILAGGGGGAYYYFFMMNDEETMEAVQDEAELIDDDEAVMEPLVEEAVPKVIEDTDYYVLPDRLNVRSYPEPDALIRAVLRKGNKVTAKEVKDGWVRISGYQVHDSGRDVADWIHTDFLSQEAPVITEAEKRKTMAALIEKSDDFVEHQDRFIMATQQLIDDGRCNFEDFELLGGWITSVTFKEQPIYFVYCGGTNRDDKVYLNVQTGELFAP